VAGAETAPTGSEPFLVSQIEFPMPLVQRGDRVEIGYDAQKAPDAVEVPDATGTLYVRNDLQRSFTAIPLELRKSPQRTCSDPNHVKLRAVVPPRLLVGHKLLYYAVIRNARLGVSVTVPATGARAPESAWIINGAFRVSLGTHVFGRPEAPEAVVAKAGPSEVGFGRDGLVFGPRSFDLGRDRSLWLWDSVNTRVLMWIPGRPNMVARTIRLPFNAGDFAAGPAGSLYLLRDGPPGTTFGWLTRLSAQGNARWTAKTARRPPGLVTGPGGTLYWTGSPPEDAKDEQARTCWGNYPFMPLAAAAGRPLSFAAQQQRSLSAEPLPGGMRLVRMLAAFDKDSTPHETRVALINRAGRLVRAWRVSSRTGIVAHGGSTLVGGDPVIVLEALGVRKSEYLVLRLGPKGGLRTRFSLPNGDSPRSAYGDLVITDIRVRPDGKLYQLGSAPGFGAAVYRHSVGRIDPPATAPAVAGRPR
jgi:hypothetical protein